MKTLAVLAVGLALSVPGSGFQVPGSGFQVPGPGFQVRFHHVHYEAADPSAAMADAVATFGGARQIVQGLGVGVKIGDLFLLFDRGAAEEPEQPLGEAYSAALTWLAARGITALPANVSRLPSGHHHVAFATSEFDAVASRLGAPIRRSAEAALFDAGGVLVEIVRETELPDAFWCPMHPDVRSGVEGKCHLCGMDLVPIPPPKIGEYRLDVAVQPDRSGARGMTIAVHDPATDALVRDFETVHEKTFHLFIVSVDLEYFAHVHPEPQPDGTFVSDQRLGGGEYMLIADFLPRGGTTQMVQKAIVVRGPGRPSPIMPPPTVHVALKAEDVAAGKDACLTFTVTDAKTGEPVTDLEPLLGAPAHMLLVKADLTDAIHAHPEEIDSRGPTISFHPLIPAAGDYKLWIQVQRRGRIETVPFRVTATR